MAALKEELRREWTKDIADALRDLEGNLDGMRFEIERLRAEFEQFKSKEFAELAARVQALEKRMQTLMSTVAGIKIPENTGSNLSDAQVKEIIDRMN